MKNKKIKSFVICMLLSIVMTLLTGCHSEGNGNDCIYYMNYNENGLYEVRVNLEETELASRIEETIEYLKVNDKNAEYYSVLNNGVGIKNYHYDNQYLDLYLEGDESELAETQDLFIKAALVKTFTKFSEISYVSVFYNGEPLGKDDSESYPYMTESDFVEISSANTELERIKLALYFPKKEGDTLAEEERQVEVSMYETIEKRTLEELMKGPNSEQLVSPIPEAVGLINVITVDHTCYVNFDHNFMEETYSIGAELVIQAISESLKGLPEVERVRIQVEGSSEGRFLDSIDLRDTF